jgi:hypothetical protein
MVKSPQGQSNLINSRSEQILESELLMIALEETY